MRKEAISGRSFGSGSFRRLAIVAAGAGLLVMTNSAGAGVVRGPDSVFSNSAGELVGEPIVNTINRSEIAPSYTPGVTDFDSYIASDLRHSLSEGEWFGPEGTTTGTLIYDMGGDYNINRVVFWNEDGWGIQEVTFSTSLTSGGVYTPVGTFFPVDNGSGMSYPAEVFDVTDSPARYIRLDLVADDTPSAGTGNSTLRYLSFGEIAFDTTPVPEPTSLALFATALLFGAARRRFS